VGAAATTIDVTVEQAPWEPAAEAAVREAIATAADVLRALPAASGEVSVVLTDDVRIRALNRDWRKLDKPTNVLSFPALARPASGGAPAGLIGDIVIAYETTAREAAADGKPFAHHLAHLAVHGFLHLLGYDHETDTEAEEMERLETRILARLDVPDPYCTQTPGT